jgi:hypothetical protein
MIATAARDYLQRGVAGTTGTADAIEITGHLRRLEEVDEGGEGGGTKGALALDLRAQRGGTTVVVERSYAESEPAESRDPEAVTAALSRALGRILDRFLSELPVERPAGSGSRPRAVERNP